MCSRSAHITTYRTFTRSPGQAALTAILAHAELTLKRVVDLCVVDDGIRYPNRVHACVCCVLQRTLWLTASGT